MITSLQIGSGKPEGQYREPHWLNLDCVRHKPRPRFVLGDGCMLPFPAGRFETIHAIHVLEHVPRKEKADRENYVGHLEFLREVARVLSPFGSAYIEVPDFVEGMRLLVAAAARGDHEEARIRTVGTFGKGRTSGDNHTWGFAPWYLENLFRQIGLSFERCKEMISGHWRQEPVMLYRVWHG